MIRCHKLKLNPRILKTNPQFYKPFVSLATLTVVQCKPLNAITVNVMSHIFHTFLRLQYKATGYCYRSVNVISLSWSQSDHIKLHPLYFLLFFRIETDLT